VYSDLHEGIVGLFEEAQYLGRPPRLMRPFLSPDEERAFRRAYESRADRRAWLREYRRRPERRKALMVQKDAYRRRIDQALRVKRPRYEVVPLFPYEIAAQPAVHQGPTVTRTCSSCGHIEELRPGLNRWQHMTPYGACVRPAR
jgi:hypothetical protein